MPLRKNVPRLISQISVVDQLVERFFLGDFSEKESKCYPNLPTLKGIGFDQLNAHIIGEQFRRMCLKTGRNPKLSDISGWEKQVTQQAVDAIADCMLRLHRGDNYETARRAIQWWRDTLLACVYVMDNGEVLDFIEWRVQRSGDYFTTTLNGMLRILVAYYCGALAARAMGDDCAEWPDCDDQELFRRYEDVGLPLRGVEERTTDDFTICSHNFELRDGKWVCWLDTWARMAFGSAHNDNYDESTLLNYEDEIRNMPDNVQLGNEWHKKEDILEYFRLRHKILSNDEACCHPQAH